MRKILIFLTIIFFSAAPVWSNDPGGAVSDEVPDFLLDEFDELSDEEEYVSDIYDPLEPLNRVFFEFNDTLYFWVIKPVKTGYSYAIPEEFRQCVGNFFNNLSAPIRMVNNLLQGRFEDAGMVFSRFLINSTIGVYGFADVALEQWNMEPRLADFGQTLGVYGIGEGVYIYWPVLGPSNLRDSVGIAGDTLAHPTYYLDLSTGELVLNYATNKVNQLSLSPPIYEDLKKYALDPYVATRKAFYDYRRNVIKTAKGEEIDF